MSFALIILCSCSTSSKKNAFEELPNFTYLDGLVPAKTINCASRSPQHCLACALQGEAADQPARGIYAVGITIMTRAKGNPKKICRITKARRQFEGMRRWGKRKISRKIWQVTIKVLEHKETGWTHFWAPKAQAKLKRKKPSWAYSYEKKQCLQEKIGDHIFFNKNKCLGRANRKLAAD